MVEELSDGACLAWHRSLKVKAVPSEVSKENGKFVIRS